MKTFNSLEETKPYYNSKNNTYEFDDDVYFKFDLAITANINAQYISALDINAQNINAWNINAGDIEANNINAFNIVVSDDINAYDINAGNIEANNIKANDIDAWNINAREIDANDISFFAVCSARKTFVCNSIVGRMGNAKYFCLDSEVIVKNAKKE